MKSVTVNFGVPAGAKCDCKELGSGSRLDHIGDIGERSEPKGKVVPQRCQKSKGKEKSEHFLKFSSPAAGMRIPMLLHP